MVVAAAAAAKLCAFLCVLVSPVAGANSSSSCGDPEAPTAPACFVAGDEMACPTLPGGSERCIISGVINQSSCCALCSQVSGCNVWTFRAPACHLRRSWQHSSPVRGECITGVLSGPLPSLTPQQTAATITIDQSNVTGPLKITGGTHNKSVDAMMGCHTDLGYSNQIRGFYAQRLFGESFENFTGQGPEHMLTGNMWHHVTAAGQATGGAEWSLTTEAPLHGLVAQRIKTSSTHAGVGVANRGYKSEGLSFAAGVGKPWEGYVFVRSAKPVTLRIALEDYFTATPAASTTLAETTLTFSGGNWSRLNFTLVPSAATTCRGFPADTPPLWCKLGNNSHKGDDAHACVQCSGQLAIYLETTESTVDLDYAYFQPGSWGRYKDLPVLLESVQYLQGTAAAHPSSAVAIAVRQQRPACLKPS